MNDRVPLKSKFLLMTEQYIGSVQVNKMALRMYGTLY